MVDLRRLSALRELATRGTIAAAADALHLTPAAVSQRLAALERELGQPLHSPNGRTVRLTPAGEAIVRHTHVLFSELERMHATLASLNRGERGSARVGAFATGIRGVVLPAVRLLRDRAPGITVEIQESEGPQIFNLLASGELDLALAMAGSGAPSPDDPRFTRIELARDVLDLALPQEHALARLDTVPLTALAEERFIAMPLGWSSDEVIRSSCEAAGFTPRITHRASDWITIISMVTAGLGVACIPRLAQTGLRPEVAIRPINEPAPSRHLFLSCRQGAEQHPVLSTVLVALQQPITAVEAGLIVGTRLADT